MFLSALFQAAVNRTSVLQVVTDRCVDIDKRQRRVIAEEFLRPTLLG